MSKEVEEKFGEIVREKMNDVYDRAIDHCIVTIKDFYNGVFNVPSDIDEIIKKLENLKSK